MDLARGCHEAPPERIGFSLSSITEISVIDLGSRSEIALIRGGAGVRRDSRGMEAEEWKQRNGSRGMDGRQVAAIVERVRHFSDIADLARTTRRVHPSPPSASDWSVLLEVIPLLTKTLAVPRRGFTRALRQRQTGRSTLALIPLLPFLC